MSSKNGVLIAPKPSCLFILFEENANPVAYGEWVWTIPFTSDLFLYSF